MKHYNKHKLMTKYKARTSHSARALLRQRFEKQELTRALTEWQDEVREFHNQNQN